MKDKLFLYAGPLTGATLADGREALLAPGCRYELPPDDPYVKGLLAQNRLTPLKIRDRRPGTGKRF